MCITLYSQNLTTTFKIRFWVFPHGLWRAGSSEHRVIPSNLTKQGWKYPLKHQEGGEGTPLKVSQLGALISNYAPLCAGYSTRLLIEMLRVQILAEAAGEISSPASTFCADSYSVSIPSLLPQWHIKDPGHSAKSAGGRLHLNTHAPLTQWSRSGLTMPQSRHSVGTYQEMSSHATHQGTVGHSHLSLLSHYGLILA